MAKYSVSLMSSSELQSLREEIDAELKRRESKLAAIEEIKRMAQDKGLKMEELLAELGGGKVRAKKERAPVPARYRNPDNKTQTWSGRGKRPLWLNAALQAGRTLDDLRA